MRVFIDNNDLSIKQLKEIQLKHWVTFWYFPIDRLIWKKTSDTTSIYDWDEWKWTALIPMVLLEEKKPILNASWSIPLKKDGSVVFSYWTSRRPFILDDERLLLEDLHERLKGILCPNVMWGNKDDYLILLNFLYCINSEFGVNSYATIKNWVSLTLSFKTLSNHHEFHRFLVTNDSKWIFSNSNIKLLNKEFKILILRTKELEERLNLYDTKSNL